MREPWGVGILALGGLVPAAVEHDYVVELEALGAVGGGQQQATLLAARVPGPFGEPLDHVGGGHGGGAELAGEDRDALRQEVGSAAAGLRIQAALLHKSSDGRAPSVPA